MNSKSGPLIHTQLDWTSFTQYIFHEHVVHCALEIRCKISCKKCHIHSIYLQFPFPIFVHFFVVKTIYANYFCHKKNLRILFMSRTWFMHFFSRKWFRHFVWKVFARWKLPSGKFRLFGPLVWRSSFFLLLKQLWGNHFSN